MKKIMRKKKKNTTKSQMPPKTNKWRNWIGTDNNLDSHLATDAGRREISKACKYLCCQIERGEESKRDHVQFVIVAKTQLVLGSYDPATKRGVGIKGFLGSNTVHVEPCRDLKKAIEYCSKEDTRVEGPFIFGDPPHAGQGKRSDLADATDAIRRGANLRELCDKFPTVVAKYPHGMAVLIANQPRPPRGEPIIIWLHGPSGAGKSKWIEENIRSKYAYGEYDDVEGATWFPDYHGEAICIFDDFNANLPFGIFNKICDRFPLSVPVKGGSVGFMASTIVFASVDSPVDETSRIRQKYDWRGELSRRLRDYGYVAQVEQDEKTGILMDITRGEPMKKFEDIIKFKDPLWMPEQEKPESPGYELDPDDEPMPEEQEPPSEFEEEDVELDLQPEFQDGYYSGEDGEYSISL